MLILPFGTLPTLANFCRLSTSVFATKPVLKQLANPHPADRESLCSQPTPHLLPPPTHGSRVGQPAFQPSGQSTSQHSQFTVLYIYLPMTLIKPVYSEPLSVTVPVVIGTCMVLVGTVESVPVPPQYDYIKKY